MYLRSVTYSAGEEELRPHPNGLQANRQTSGEMAAKLTSCKGFVLIACLSALLLIAGAISADCQEQLNVESRQQKENDDLNAEIKYLENLDNIYSQVGRPRWGRSDHKEPNWLGVRSGAIPQVNQLSGVNQRQLASLVDLLNGRLGQRFREQTY